MDCDRQELSGQFFGGNLGSPSSESAAIEGKSRSEFTSAQEKIIENCVKAGLANHPSVIMRQQALLTRIAEAVEALAHHANAKIEKQPVLAPVNWDDWLK